MKKIYAICAIMIMFFLIYPLPASALSADDTREVIVVFDTSQSMLENDTERMAPDSIKQLISCLTSNYKVGFVSFNSDVYTLDVGVPPKDIANIVDKIVYADYTNTGLAMQTALNMFSDSVSQKSIILISDGEISMPIEADTQQSGVALQGAVEQAKTLQIPVHLLGIGNAFEAYGSSILNIPAETGGVLHRFNSASDMSRAVEDLLFNVFNIKKSTIGAGQLSWENSQLIVDIPNNSLTSAKVLITAGAPLSNVTASFQGDDPVVTIGNQFVVVDIESPQSGQIQIALSASEKTNFQAELISEYHGELRSDVTYIDSESDDGSIKRTADISLWLENDQGINIFNNPEFEGVSLPVHLDNTEEIVDISSGHIDLSGDITEGQTVIASIDVSQLNANIFLDSTVEICLKGIKKEGVAIDFLPLVITLSALGVLLVAIILLSRRKKSAIEPKAAVVSLDNRNTFSGKLNIYVLRTKKDLEIPPLTFDLFRRSSKKSVSLSDILQECKVPMVFPGVDKILLLPGKEHDIIIQNDSDCTLLQGRDILIKSRSRSMNYGEKLHITCEDFESELELHYRSASRAASR